MTPARLLVLACLTVLALLCGNPLTACAAVVGVVRDLTINQYGQCTGVVDQLAHRCAADGRIAKSLFVNTTGNPGRLVCSSLAASDPCSLQSLRGELMLGDDSVTAAELAAADQFMLMNITLSHPNYLRGNRTIGGFPTLVSADPTEEVSTWFAETRFSKLNVSSSCFCIHQVYLVTSTGRTVRDDLLLDILLQGANSSDAVLAADEIVLNCVLGTALGVTAPGGVGMAVANRIMYDSTNGTLVQFEQLSDLTVALRTLWNQAAWSDVLNPTFIDNRSATPALGHWPLVATSLVGEVFMQQPAATLVTMWFGKLTFCNTEISVIRSITTGVERSSDVVVEVDWSLLDVYAILPLEMAKAIAIRATAIDATTCWFACGLAAASAAANTSNASDSSYGIGIANAPCRYTCAFAPAYQPLPNMTAAQRRNLQSSLQWLVPPLYLATLDDASTSTKALQLNLSFYVTVGAEDGRNYLSFTTWDAFIDDVTPTLLLGGLFSIERSLQKAKYIVIDRVTMQVGISPTVTSVTLSSSTTPKLDDVCTPVPLCGDDEVLIVEINRCVNTKCAGYFFMRVSTETGECWMESTYIAMAGFLLVLIIVGEFILTLIDFQTSRVLHRMQAKSDATIAS